jgi:NAD(P) transhydrogenase subunit beta
MALAVAATLFGAGSGNLFLTLVMIAFGAVAGYYVANRVQMTEMPKLVAALHSFVGLAAVFMGINAEIALADVLAARASGATEAFTGFAAVLAHKTPAEIAMLKVEVFLGIFIGAVTFTGSIVAFGKLAGKIDGIAKKYPGGHALNAGAALICLAVGIAYHARPRRVAPRSIFQDAPPACHPAPIAFRFNDNRQILRRCLPLRPPPRRIDSRRSRLTHYRKRNK